MIEYPINFVPLPIGNRDDISKRALEVLASVDVICCEDTRHTGLLLAHYEITGKKLLSMHEHNEQHRAPEIASRALAGERFAIVTDAGTPGLSDPGYRLIQELKRQSIEFTVLPGPAAVITALVGSGLPSDAFFFGGFLPVKSGKKRNILEHAHQAHHTSIFYESPFRIVKTVKVLAEIDPELPCCVARELTKRFETYHRGTAQQLAEMFEKQAPKGEIVLLIGGQNTPRISAEESEETQV